MKYCLSCRQDDEILSLADEIYVKEKDWRIIPDLFIKYPSTPVILEWETNQIKKEQILNLSIAGNLICCINKLNVKIEWFKENNIKFFYKFPVSTFYDIQGLIDLGVEYIRITGPLVFQMNVLSNFDMKFRAVPHIAYDAYIPRENGLFGQWIRPEDTKYYEKSIYLFEFEDTEILQEKTLFKIYKKDKKWMGNLNNLFINFNIDIDNRAILESLGKKRSNCGLRCQKDSSCHFCETVIKYYNAINLYKNTTEQNEKN